MKRTIPALILALLLLLGAMPAAAAVSDAALDRYVSGSAAYVYAATPSPQVGSIGGEWAVLGLARSGYAVPEKYYQDYYAALEQYVRDCGGVLHEKKYTEYSRVIVALSSLGIDARNVAGYDLTKPLGDYDKTIWQGLNGPVWALIARDYPEPSAGIRQKYVDRILDCQLDDGGWNLLGGTGPAGKAQTANPDITGMALQALAKYQDQPAVAKATREALDCMSAQQAADGSFSYGGTANAESIAQMIVALAELGIPQDDPRFVKNGVSLLDVLLTYRQADGSFRHAASGEGDDRMTAEQGLYALAAAQRQQSGKNSLYRMGDAVPVSLPEAAAAPEPGTGLPGKHADVSPRPVTKPGLTLSDVARSPNRAAIEALTAREIINGMGDGTFAPEKTMTRAEYAAIVVRALGLAPDAAGAAAFTDVPARSWFASFVGTACKYGIVNGRGNGVFDPQGTITRQEAAVMTVRAAGLCGLDTSVGETESTDILCGFADYRTVASWAKENMAWCYKTGVLDDSALKLEPAKEILRGEVAEMLYRMLVKANLIG